MVENFTKMPHNFKLKMLFVWLEIISTQHEISNLMTYDSKMQSRKSIARNFIAKN